MAVLYKPLDVFNSLETCIYCMLQARNVLLLIPATAIPVCESAPLVFPVEQASASPFDIVFYINVLVSLYCCESILY